MCSLKDRPWNFCMCISPRSSPSCCLQLEKPHIEDGRVLIGLGFQMNPWSKTPPLPPSLLPQPNCHTHTHTLFFFFLSWNPSPRLLDKREICTGTWVAQWLSICLRLWVWPRGPGIQSCMRFPAGSLVLPLPVSLPLSLCLSWINK